MSILFSAKLFMAALEPFTRDRLVKCPVFGLLVNSGLMDMTCGVPL